MSFRRFRVLFSLLFLVFSGVLFTTNIPAVAAADTTTACALNPTLLSGQGFTVSGLGFSTTGFGFSTSGLGFSTTGFGFTTSGLGIDPLQVANDIRSNPISNEWLKQLLPSISSGDKYNTVKTAILIVDDTGHGDLVAAVFQHLMEGSNAASNILVTRVDIGGSSGYRTDNIAALIDQKINELKLLGYKHFAINMSFGLIPCEDAGPTFDGKTYPFNFQDMLSWIATANQPPAPQPIYPFPECVQNLGDGKYLARFSYKNLNTTPIYIPIGEKNKFYPTTPIDRGQPLIFEPGYYTNVFTVPFDGSQIQWFVTGPDGVRRNASLKKDSKQCSSPLPTPTKGISAVLECVAYDGNGTYTARFGYNNENSVAVSVPLGDKNRFTPDPINRNQPNIFLPGRHYDVFRVPFNGSNLVWTLTSPTGTRTSTASSQSKLCVDDNGKGLQNYLRDKVGVPGQYVDDYLVYLFNKPDDNLNNLRLLLRQYLDQSASSKGEFAVYPVASSGNYRPWLGGAPLAPARWNETIAVGATLGNFGGLWQFSHDGNVLAPGAGFPLVNNTFIAGTSFAAPFISAYLAHFGTYPNACTYPILNGVSRPPLVAPDALGNATVLTGQPSPFTCVPPKTPSFVCYADYVVDYIPGIRKDGKPVPDARRNAAKALGAPQKNDTENFVSLGFDNLKTTVREGVLILGFNNRIINGAGNDFRVWETSYGDANRPWSNYPEKVKIYAAQNAEGPWTFIGETTDKDQAYDLGSLEWAKFLKLEDTTDRNKFGGDGDGFDVDAIEAYTCQSGGSEGFTTALLALPEASTGRTSVSASVVARAGEDIVKVDRKGKGKKKVRLDASASYSVGKKIVSYEWSLPGFTIDPVAQPKVRLPVGTYEITLTVTDKKGNRAVDTVTVTVTAGDDIGLPISEGRSQP